MHHKGECKKKTSVLCYLSRLRYPCDFKVIVWGVQHKRTLLYCSTAVCRLTLSLLKVLNLNVTSVDQCLLVGRRRLQSVREGTIRHIGFIKLNMFFGWPPFLQRGYILLFLFFWNRRSPGLLGQWITSVICPCFKGWKQRWQHKYAGFKERLYSLFGNTCVCVLKKRSRTQTKIKPFQRLGYQCSQAGCLCGCINTG